VVSLARGVAYMRDAHVAMGMIMINVALHEHDIVRDSLFTGTV
jgi:hypothetical protein